MATTAIIPFWNGPELDGLLDDLGEMSVIVVRDMGSSSPQFSQRDNVSVITLDWRGYFAGAVNAGVDACKTDTLILNQDVRLRGAEWRALVDNPPAPVFGEGVFAHPAWPGGYVQGTFMFVARSAWQKAGALDARNFPLWGCTAEWQCRAARCGLNVQPMSSVPGLEHARRNARQFGSAIARALADEPNRRALFLQTPPIVSVIVPCYNYGRYLQDAVDSLMAQTFQAFEVVIVDDASTDGSWAECQRLADPLKGIRAVRHETNRGTAAALNTGVKNSYGRLVTVLSADDMYMPQRLTKLYAAAVRNPGSAIYDDVIWREPGGDGVKRMRPYFFDDLAGDEPGLLSRNSMHAGVMYPRKAWSKAGGYPEVMRDGREDWAFNIALGRVGCCGVHVPEPLYVYRREGQNRSLTNTTPQHHAEFLSRLRKLFPDVYSGRYPMGCCGGRRTARTKKAISTRRPTPGKAPSVAPDGMSELRYVGANVGNETWWGRETGQTYQFGLNARYQNNYVQNEDVAGFLATRLFVTVGPPAPEPEPAETVEATDEPTIESVIEADMTEVEDAIQPTEGAKQYAAQLGIDLTELDKRGRITKRDVDDYAKRIGRIEAGVSGVGDIQTGATS